MIVKTFIHFFVFALLWHGSSSMDISNGSITPGSNLTTRSISPRALSGSISNNFNAYYTAYIDWSASQSASALTSTITATFYIKKTAASSYRSYNNYGPPYSITIGGTKYSGTQSFDFAANCAIGTTQTIGTASRTVSHNSDGSISAVSISATLESDIGWGTVTVSGSASLNKISVSVVVYYNGNGGTASTSSKTVTYGGTYGTLATATRTGYSFTGWYTASSGGSVVTAGTSVTTTSAHTLYAHWSVIQYTVYFNGNGGTASTSSKTVTYDSTYGTLATATRTGYSFKGWYTASSGGSGVTAGTSMTTAYDHTLYAQWSAIQYTVYFNGNGGSASTSSTIVTYGSAYGSLATATRSDYNFIGWYTASSGGSPVSSGTTVTTAYDHTLYAQWAAIQYTITFVANGGSDCSSITGVCDSPFTLPSSSRTGYTFDYWCTDSSLTTRYTGSTMPRYSFTLYAKWTANQYTAYYDGNGGTASTASKTVIYDSPYGNLATAIKTGYDFNGWYTEPSGGSLVTVSTPMTTASDHTIYAQWTISSFTITFKSDGNVISSSKINYMDTIIYPPDQSKTGHTFNGWDSSITSVPAHDVTINAKWIANKYFITVEDENNKVLVAGMFDYGTDLSFPSTSKVGYTSIFTTNEGDVLTTVPAYDVDLRVDFAIITYTMTFAYEDGTVIGSCAQTYGSKINFPTVKKEGHKFSGWRTNENVVNTTTVPAADTLFYPVFTPNTYKAMIIYSGDRNIVKEFKCGDVIDFTSLGNEVLNGFEVLGWYMDANFTDKIESNSITVPAYNIELYPYVISNRVEIVFDTKDLSEKDVESIIKGYTDAEFVIESFEDRGEITVIIRFNDVEEAKEFVRIVSSIDRNGNNNYIASRVNFINGEYGSSSAILVPFSIVTTILSLYSIF